MRIDSAGNVGIGTSSPAYRLDVSTALTGTAAGDNTAIALNSQASGRDANIRFGDSVNATARIGYLSGALYMYTNGAERLRLNTSGNLGLGVTPSAWGSVGLKAFQIGGVALTQDDTIFRGRFFTNTGVAGGSFVYLQNNHALQYLQRGDTGEHSWYTAPSGTAGNAISFTQAMTLNASGRLGIGTTSPGFRLDISGGGTTAKINTLDTNDGGASLSTWMKVGRRAGTGTNAYINTLHSGSDAVDALTFAFGTSGTGTERARITSGGELLVGLNSATGVALLQVSGPIRTTGYTVATLPAGTVGMRTYVTDALAPSFGVAVAGSGAVTIPVFYDGANWIVA
jgi:hypothetical protein